MKKNASNKGLLLPWLLKALNEELYDGLKWSDRQRKIFYILWTHKSAEQWSKNDLEPFKAWAAHKGKLDGKNEKQLKATFRCALNSKKELKEVYRTRTKRFWQFVDPNSTEKDATIKKRRKVKSTHVDAELSVPHSESGVSTSTKSWSSLRIDFSSDVEMTRSTELPPFESLCSFAPLTPPHLASENSFNSSELEASEKITNRKEISRLNPELDDPMRSSTSLSTLSSIYTSSLSSIGSSGSEEYRTNYTPSPEHNRLTPPQKHSHNTSHSFHHSSTDVWQPNCWTTPQAHQEFTNLNQFFSNDFIEMYKSTSLELDNNMDFLEMDQYVPVMDISHNNQIIPSRNGQHYLTYKTERKNDQFEKMKLDDDYLLNDDVDQEACQKIMQELDRLSPSAESRLYDFNS